MTGTRDLVVVSHLRWTWVWQRPQHIIARLARNRRVWFVEEPQRADVLAPRLASSDAGPVTRLWLELPGGAPPEEEVLGGAGHLGFDAPEAGPLGPALARALAGVPAPVVWLYTPLGLEHVADLDRAALVYDVMDDLSAFRNAAPGQQRARRAAFSAADLILTGGRSLDAGARRDGAERTFLFPSGVERGHFAAAARLRRPRPRPVAGYVGVIDERLDLRLLGDLARRLPDWDLELVGPIAKLTRDELPQAPNLRYLGHQPYGRLPAVMAGFDVGLMPFALTRATRSISPTKTFEYLAAGLPVVSTRVPDVVADHADVVALADDAAGFAAACRAALEDDDARRAARAGSLLERNDWDAIAARIDALIDGAVAGAPLDDRTPNVADRAA